MIFIETPIFTSQISDLMSDEDFGDFQQELANNPKAGSVIKGTGGLRKIRVAAKGHGKRGGARIIYYYFAFASQIVLIFAYPKNVRDSLTQDQKKALRKVIEQWR